MLERIERQNHVRFFVRARRERTSIRNPTLGRRCTRIRQRTLTNVDADHFPRATRRDLNRILTIAATKVDHDLVFGVAPDVFPKQLFDLADALIRAAVAVTSLAVDTDAPQQVVSERT